MKVLITGASNGIGLELAQALRDSNSQYEVWAVCRNPNKGGQLETQGIKVFYADLSDLVQTKRVAKEVIEAGGVDVLVNNAGMPLTKRVVEGANKTVLVNLVSPYVLAHTLLSERKVSKVINVSSVTHWCGELITRNNCADPKCDHYANSKLSIMALSFHLERSFQWAEIVTVNPGYVDTGIWHPKAPGEWLHKYIRRIFALKPADTVRLFENAIETSYTSHVYLSPYRNSYVMTWLRKCTPQFMLLNDFLGKLLFWTGKPELTDINPKCFQDHKVAGFLKSFDIEDGNKFCDE